MSATRPPMPSPLAGEKPALSTSKGEGEEASSAAAVGATRAGIARRAERSLGAPPERDTGNGRQTKGPFDEVRALDLVARYQRGQEGALADLYRFLEPAIRTGLRRYRSAELPTSLTRQDISQQCWVILADLTRRWRPKGSFLAYFFRTFPHALQRFVQATRPQRRTVEVMVPHDEVMLAADRVREAEPVWQARPGWEEMLARVPAPERQAFVLHSAGGQSFAAIGEVLGVSHATAHRLHQRAVARLSNQLDRPDAGASQEAAIVRLVHALHAGATSTGAVSGRRWTLLAARLARRDYAELMARLEAAGALVDRRPGRSGRLAYRTPEETLQHLFAHEN